jgi:hypothetical protein
MREYKIEGNKDCRGNAPSPKLLFLLLRNLKKQKVYRVMGQALLQMHAGWLYELPINRDDVVKCRSFVASLSHR